MTNERLIVITAEDILKEEPALWVDLLGTAIYRLHIRKPKASTQELSSMIAKVPVSLRKKLVIHHQPEIAAKYELGGVHLPYNATIQDSKSPVSSSVHSWQEAQAITHNCAYYFISPVFDSISKSGYKKNLELERVPAGLPNKKVYALGGIDINTAGLALSYGYHGIVAHGYIWNEQGKAVERVLALLNITAKENMEI